jgi:hypothetical protein
MKSNHRAFWNVDPLEGRVLLAGNVTASVQGGDLIIRGDSQDNVVTIKSAGAGKVRIAGADDTEVNGRASVVLSLAGNLIIRMQPGGQDNISLQGPLEIAGDLRAQFGKGDFFVEGTSGAVTIDGNLDAHSSSDGNITARNEVHVRGKTSMDTKGDVTASSAVATQPTFSASNFHNPLNINNPYFPVVPGSKRVYESRAVDEDTGEVTIQANPVEVTSETPTIDGVKVRVVRDRVYEGGLLIEDTRDFHAQDDKGNVWYFGEDVTNIQYDDKGHEISRDHDGSWTAGIDGAVPGIVMEAKPRVGHRYFQEFAPGNVLDHGEGLATNETAKVPVATYQHVFRTEEATVIEPTSLAEKLYAPGIGTIVEYELDLEDREVIETVTLKSATLNGKPVTTFVAPGGFAGTNVGGRFVGPATFAKQVDVNSTGPIIFNGTKITDTAHMTSNAQVILIQSNLADATLRSGNTVSLNHVQSERKIHVSGDTDLLVFNSDIDRLCASLGAGDNDVIIQNSEFDILRLDGGGGHNTLAQRGHNDIESLRLRRLTRV